MASAPGLIRFAARYTRSLHDAEDAYQRAMEIALLRAPVTEPRRFMAWLHTVLRNEALAVARARRREGPGAELDVAESCAERSQDGPGVDALAEWRERYRSIQDGLGGLTDAQRVCLILKSAGASYERIRELTGFSLRKVERSVLEGRASLHAWEVRLASGDVCEKVTPLIDRVAGGEATARERRTVTRHVRHCGPCRAVLRNRRESNEWLAGLVPVALVASETLAAGPADPSPLIAWWERLAGGATVRAGNAVQMAMELPGAALAKVGAGTAAVVVAGAAGAPMLADAIRPGQGPPPTAAALVRPASSATEAGGGTAAPQRQARPSTPAVAPRVAARRPAARDAQDRQVERAARRRAPVTAASPREPAPVVARSAPAAARPAPAPLEASVPAPVAVASPAPTPSPAPAPGPATVALEFGP
jgi:RNA polymerase sigma factor (sigma-70 family)